MNPCVIDASVAAKWFFEEEHSANARALLADVPRHIAPDFILMELANTGLKRVRRGAIDADDARSASVRVANLLVLYDTRPVVPAALEIALTFGRSVYDSLYIALASLLERQIITADRKLYNAMAATDLASTMFWIGDVPLANS